MKPALLVALALTALMAAPAVAAPVDLERVTVAELQAEMAAGELTSVELTKAYLNRIAALNKRGPGLNAVRQAIGATDPLRTGRYSKTLVFTLSTTAP